ncbi:MAG: response regulator transcription factor [Syntrophobacteraceae bacterium]
MMESILVIDDDVELCELLFEYLGREGFEVVMVHDGREGLDRALSESFALIVLDVMLPSLNGFEVLQGLRARSGAPVLMLTARGEDVDRIVGLEMGADDYLPKPFNPRELVARIRAIMRRVRPKAGVERDAALPETVVVGDVAIDPGVRSVLCGGKAVDLTSVEFNLLELLVRASGRVVSREDLASGALGRGLGDYDRSIDVHVSSLRKKLGRHESGVERIKAVRGVGYLYTIPSKPNGAGPEAE